MFRTVALFMFLAIAGVAQAADVGVYRAARAPASPIVELPFPRSERAHAIWAGDTCFSSCGAQCNAGLDACLRMRPDAQARCLTSTDTCDRYCQRQCRYAGGPLIPDLLDGILPPY